MKASEHLVRSQGGFIDVQHIEAKGTLADCLALIAQREAQS
jgi:hypothetical protein